MMTEGERTEEQRTEGVTNFVENGKIKNKYGMPRDIHKQKQEER